MKTILTVKEAAAVMMVKNGADIWARHEAGIFRAIEEKTGKDIIHITKAMNAPEDGAKQQPYFGVIATPAGRVLAETMLRKHYHFKKGERLTSKRAERIFNQAAI